jgi:hypothetical protein
MLSNQSCENNDIDETKQNTVLNDDIRSKGGPVEGVDLTTQSDLISIENHCYTFQIRIYASVNGGTAYLVHSAIMTTCQETQGNSTPNNFCDGIKFLDDYIVRDDMVNGCIIDFLNSDPEIEDLYLAERSRIVQ